MNKSVMALSIALALTTSLTGCTHSSNKSSPVVQAENTRQLEAKKVNEIVEQFFTEMLVLDPLTATEVGVNDYNDRFIAPISKQSIEENIAFEQKYLNRISAIDVNQLSGQDLLSYQVFKRDREVAIAGYEFPEHYIPFNQMYGIHNDFAMLGSGESSQPFNTEKDYRDFMKRAEGFSAYMDSTILSMREGSKKGVVLPKAIIKKLLPQFQTHLVKNIEDSVFYGPVKQLQANTNINTNDKERLARDYSQMIQNVIIPTYQKTLSFLTTEYAPLGSDTVGLSHLPNGKAWYDHMITHHTTLPLTADEIHEFGQQEVARILAEMKKVKQTVGFKGNLAEFFTFLKEDEQFYFSSPEEVIAAYEGVKDKINSRVSQLFEVFPKADYQVKEVEAFRAASSAGASYQAPAPDGSRPGTFYINTFNLKAQPNFIVETLSIHEASPGHHFQASIQQEVESLPKFRKFGNFTVYEEGWALYAESLGKEMGLFTDPYQWYGRLVDEQLRAMRLVVDTGMHAKGWTREQAIDFMTKNSSMADSDIEAEVERYVSIPGQALSYKTGQRAIQQMRESAKKSLGSAFDIKKFHTQILIDGSLPMPILAAKIERWVDAQKVTAKH
ncbi:DUF885 domain-containing protein [Litorilituus lipolyticus]|uniref:DUF885 domain-containing protein n=1 Tax=Litorilituus lipolyticus TaxID=2491017 RepID=A0A502KT97_9GAMM|nr:DUF885 domain-containing protein [Litorilituus lipolyticus]TPH12883.1 DUF885 domain-containing protein [Litorilituus lipolyticus]